MATSEVNAPASAPDRVIFFNSSKGKGNKLMDQTFETFMDELRAEKGPEEDTITSLCQKDRPHAGVSGARHSRRQGMWIEATSKCWDV